MNEEKLELLFDGIKLLIESNDCIKESEKKVWIFDYNNLFNYKQQISIADRTHDALCESEVAKEGVDVE